MNRTLASVLAVTATLALVVIAAAGAYSAVQARETAQQLDKVQSDLRIIRECIADPLALCAVGGK